MLCGCIYVALMNKVYDRVPQQEPADSGHDGQPRLVVQVEHAMGIHACSMACYNLRQCNHLLLHSLPPQKKHLTACKT